VQASAPAATTPAAIHQRMQHGGVCESMNFILPHYCTWDSQCYGSGGHRERL
jgi:hypothetical protein